MNIDLLKFVSDEKIMDKQFETIGENISCTPFENIDILNPKISLTYNTNYLSANYVYIPLFNRYYKIIKPIVKVGERIDFECTVDALRSWKTAIEKCNITVLRNGGLGTPTKITDSRFPIIPNEQELTQTVCENSAFTPYGEKCYVLTVIGGALS